jgi:hypothetical protein
MRFVLGQLVNAQTMRVVTTLGVDIDPATGEPLALPVLV